jgi:hypothetical protein
MVGSAPVAEVGVGSTVWEPQAARVSTAVMAAMRGIVGVLLRRIEAVPFVLWV